MSTAFSNAINLVKSPANFMRQNKDTAVPVNSVIINYVAVLAVIPFIATLIGNLWFYSYLSVLGFLGAGFYGYVFALAVVTYVLDVIGVYVLGLAIWKLAPSFGTTTDQARATLLAAFVFTPSLLISILNIIPYLSLVTFLGLLYGLYILYLGLPIMLGTPSDKVITYVVVIVIVSIIIFGVIAAILGAITAAIFLSRFLYP